MSNVVTPESSNFLEMRYRFLSYELDTKKLTLSKDGDVQNIPSQVYSILEVLISNRDQIISKQDLIEKVWDGRQVSPNSIDSRIRTARSVIGDDGVQQKLIKTFTNRGFKFIGDVTELDDSPNEAPDVEIFDDEVLPQKKSIKALALLGLLMASIFVIIFMFSGNETSVESEDNAAVITTPVIVLTPFNSKDENEYAQDLSEKITYEVRRNFELIPDLQLVSASILSNPGMDDFKRQKFYQQFNVDYVLSGHTTYDGNVARIYLALEDIRAQSRIWSESLDIVFNEDNEILITQRIAERISARVAGALNLTQPVQFNRYGKSSAYPLFLQARQLGMSDDSPDVYQNQINLLNEALVLDPNFAPAHAGLVSVYNLGANYLNMPAAEAREKMNYHHDVGMEIDPESPEMLNASALLAFKKSRPEEALVLLDKTIGIAPNKLDAHFHKARILFAMGKYVEAEQAYMNALKFNPTSPSALFNLTLIKIDLGKMDEALDLAKRNLAWHSSNTIAIHSMAYVLLLKGDYKSTHEQLLMALDANPNDSYVQSDLVQLYARLNKLDLAKDKISHPVWRAILQTYSSDFELAQKVQRDSVDPYNLLALGYFGRNYEGIGGNAQNVIKYYDYSATDRFIGKSDLKVLSMLVFALRQTNDQNAEIMKSLLSNYFETNANLDSYTTIEFEAAIALKIFEGDFVAALEIFDKAEQRGLILLNLHKEPIYEPLQGYIKYAEVLSRMESKSAILNLIDD